MVSTKMSPERPLLGTMSATSAFLSRGLAGAQATHDLDPPAGAHAARHRDRRQHDALVGMAVRADVALAHRLGEEQREPVRRQLAAALEAVGIHVEGAGGAAHGHQADIVLDDAHPADPAAAVPSIASSIQPAMALVPPTRCGAVAVHASSKEEGPGWRGPFHGSKDRVRSDRVVHLVPDRRRLVFPVVDLFPLELHVGVDLVVGEHAALGEEGRGRRRARSAPRAASRRRSGPPSSSSGGRS